MDNTINHTPRHPVIVALVLLCVVRVLVLASMAVVKEASISETALTVF